MANSDSNFDENSWESFYKSLEDESERGAVIISAAFLDSLLRDMLANFMIDLEKDIIELLGDDDNSYKPLSGFLPKITVSYFLGFLSKSEYEDLKLINTIRNKFAHRKHGFTFTNDEIITRCNKLQTLSFFGEHLQSIFNTPFKRFKFTVSQLAMRINLRISEARDDRRKVRGEIQISYKFIPNENNDLFPTS